MKRITIVLLFLTASASLFAEENLQLGISAFQERNNPEAITYLESAMAEDPGNDEIYLYLGLLYQNTGRLDKAQTIMEEGMTLYGPNRELLTYNLANLHFSRQQYDQAIQKYTEVVSNGFKKRNEATLNRANVYMKTQDYKQAASDYEDFLILAPEDPQAPKIRELLALLYSQIAYQEEQVRLAEEQRLAEERRRAEEEARQKALLDDILGDLNTAGDDTTSYSAGSENIDQDFSDSDIEE